MLHILSDGLFDLLYSQARHVPRSQFGGCCRGNLFRRWLLCPMGVFRVSIYNDYRAFCRNEHGGGLRTQAFTDRCRQQEQATIIG